MSSGPPGTVAGLLAAPAGEDRRLGDFPKAGESGRDGERDPDDIYDGDEFDIANQ